MPVTQMQLVALCALLLGTAILYALRLSIVPLLVIMGGLLMSLLWQRK